MFTAAPFLVVAFSSFFFCLRKYLFEELKGSAEGSKGGYQYCAKQVYDLVWFLTTVEFIFKFVWQNFGILYLRPFLNFFFYLLVGSDK
jgi:hypothetical protein